MKRIFIILGSFFACVLAIYIFTGMTPKDTQETKNNLRILDLLPNLLSPLAVDPGILADFISLSPNGTLDLYDCIFWGPKDVLKAYFEDPASLKVPILRVNLSANIVQAGPNSFHNGFIEHLKKMEEEKIKGFAYIETQWGDYPVVAIRHLWEGQLNFVAWVGLNDPATGLTLLFDLVYPIEKWQPNKEERKLWENLLTKTTQLTDGDHMVKTYRKDIP